MGVTPCSVDGEGEGGVEAGGAVVVGVGGDVGKVLEDVDGGGAGAFDADEGLSCPSRCP